jgi:ribosomal protein S18 acetylase RimI-like enzyme
VYQPNATALANRAAMAPALDRLVAIQSCIPETSIDSSPPPDERIVGTVRWGVFDDCLRVIALAVHPAARRRGIARQLVEELANIARQRRCRALALYTITRTGTVAVFERLGFHVVRLQPDQFCISVTGEPLIEAYMETPIIA